jgi:hypothetical protein
MRIIWNQKESCFEAEFQDFQGDLAAVKAAGFRTTGAPGWVWYTLKVEALDKLRKNRPASGLTILEDALVEYNRLKEQETKKAALLAELKAAKKKTEPKETKVFVVPHGQEFGYNCVEDSDKKIRIGYVPPEFTGPRCVVCNDEVYFYELQEPPTCLSCELELDKQPELF